MLRARDADELAQAADVRLVRHRKAEQVGRHDDAHRVRVQTGDPREVRAVADGIPVLHIVVQPPVAG